MEDVKHVLLLGDRTDAPWHPLEPVERELKDLLGAGFAVDATEDYNRLSGQDLKRFPLCISYTDCWNRGIPSEQTAGLIKFVAEGGGLLVLHNGISLQSSHELLTMVGAHFTGHPPYQTLDYFGSSSGHPLLAGVEDFTMEEEPYQFEFVPFTPRRVFLEYAYEGRRYPAGWEQTWGLGRVVYLQPGHHAASFHSEAYRQLVRNSAYWACGRTP